LHNNYITATATISIPIGFIGLYLNMASNFASSKIMTPMIAREYLKMQGRFRHLGEEQVKEVEERVMKRWGRLLRRAEEST